MSPKAQREDAHTSTCRGRSLLLFSGSFLTTSVEGPSQHPPCASREDFIDLSRHKGLHPRRDLIRAQPGHVTSLLAALPHRQGLRLLRGQEWTPVLEDLRGISWAQALAVVGGCQARIQDSWCHLSHRHLGIPGMWTGHSV